MDSLLVHAQLSHSFIHGVDYPELLASSRVLNPSDVSLLIFQDERSHALFQFPSLALICITKYLSHYKEFVPLLKYSRKLFQERLRSIYL